MKLEDGSVLTFNGRLPEGTEFDKFFKQYGGKCIGGPATFSEGGEYEYQYEFSRISKDKLYEMMMTEAQPDWDDLNIFKLLSNHRQDAEEIQKFASEFPDNMIEALFKIYNNEGDDVMQDYIIKFEEI